MSRAAARRPANPPDRPIDEDEDPDLAFVDQAVDEGQRGFDEDDGIPGSGPVDSGPVDPDRPARSEPLEPLPPGHEPKGPGSLPGVPGADPDDASDDEREQRKPARDG